MNQHRVRANTPEEVIANYTPRQVSPYQWVKIRDFVMSAVTATASTGETHVRRQMTAAAAFIAWAHFVAGHPLTPQILDIDLIAEWVENETAYSPSVKKQERARLKWVAKHFNPDFPELPDETAYGSAWRPNPYTQSEVLEIEGWARGQRTAVRRVKAALLLSLSLGAGLYTHEVARLRVRHVEAIEHGGVLINVPGQNARSVPVLDRYSAPLLEALNHLEPDQYVFSPTRVHEKTSVVQNFIKGTNSTLDAPPSPRRMRSTWIIGHIRAGVPAKALVEAAGLTNLRAFERWVYSVPEFTREQFHDWMWAKGRGR